MVGGGDPLLGRHLGGEGQYRIDGVLGRGGMASVYGAVHITRAWQRPIAIKVLTPELARQAGFAERFLREARIAASLRHPHILTAFDFGETDGLPYLVMDLIEGGTLLDQMRAGNGQPWPLDRVLPLASDVLGALGAAHRHGIVHRDVKPSNILIERDSGSALLSDFGIARALGIETANLTGSHGFLGTPAYAAPEQILGEPVDHRADLYSFGMVLYELLAGRLPYASDQPLADAFKRIHEGLPPARSFNSTVPVSLEPVLDRALARQPDQRFQSADEFRAALSGTAAQALTVTAPPRQTASGSRRKSTLAAAAGAVLLLVVGGLAMLLASAPHATTPTVAAAPIATQIATSLPTVTPAAAVVQPAPTPPPATDVPTAIVTPTPAAPTPTPLASPGTILMQDDFGDPNASQLYQTESDPRVKLSVENGAYRVQTLDTSTPNELVPLNESFGDVSIDVDARFAGPTDDRLLVVGCRGRPDQADPGGYYVFVLPPPAAESSQGSVQLMRRDRGWVPLSTSKSIPMQPADTDNHVELRCVGTRIIAAINGREVAQALDGEYVDGVPLLGLSVNSGSALTSDARFSHLQITQR